MDTDSPTIKYTLEEHRRMAIFAITKEESLNDESHRHNMEVYYTLICQIFVDILTN